MFPILRCIYTDISMEMNSASRRVSPKAWRTFLNSALNDPSHPNFKGLEWCIIICTGLSVLVTVISTVPELFVYHRVFLGIEVACALFFMVEYVCRLCTSANRRAYAFSLWGFIDLMSFLPTIFILVPLPAVVFAQQLKILLAFRSLRIAKLARTYILESRCRGKGEGHQEDEEFSIPVSVFFFTQISASILNGAIMYAVEGSQPNYATMPKAILEVTKVLLDSDPTPPQTTFGQIFVLFIYFQRLCLLGLLIEVMGSAVKRLLFGHSK